MTPHCVKLFVDLCLLYEDKTCALSKIDCRSQTVFDLSLCKFHSLSFYTLSRRVLLAVITTVIDHWSDSKKCLIHRQNNREKSKAVHTSGCFRGLFELFFDWMTDVFTLSIWSYPKLSKIFVVDSKMTVLKLVICHSATRNLTTFWIRSSLSSIRRLTQQNRLI